MSHRENLIEVKSQAASTGTIIVTKNEILGSLNQPGDYVRAIMEALGSVRPTFLGEVATNQNPTCFPPRRGVG